MRPTKWIFLAVAAALAIGAALGADYIGAAKCKFCHKVQYNSWLETKHAKAFELLQPDEQSREECLGCHATGSSADLPGVQCEACHGAGSDYKSMKVMKDRDAAVAAGLVVPTKDGTCVPCHTGAPHELSAFDYDEAVKTGIHEFKSE
jgi:nitrate/TMAO reductase-like tetraheme cytochrome c subunit